MTYRWPTLAWSSIRGPQRTSMRRIDAVSWAEFASMGFTNRYWLSPRAGRQSTFPALTAREGLLPVAGCRSP